MDEIVDHYSSMIHAVLSAHPSALAEFDQFIGRLDHRSAFVLVEKTMRDNNLAFTSEQDQIAQRFFWSYIY